MSVCNMFPFMRTDVVRAHGTALFGPGLLYTNWTDRCMIECKKYASKVALLDGSCWLKWPFAWNLGGGWGDLVTVHGSNFAIGKI